ncbi:MAG: TIGR00374 family protein [Confluentimicrobium sp.]|mgnify:FL=1|jgi:uncharacterized protein (TIRG00374 family)|uniref:lysylphosphatidylglycerol synthase transmembrane domain-containing protein n=1 Tax=Roseobacteraceae TaxID=2854170 RepID=UPI000C683886|nr:MULTISPECIES: lysylphosphatidylglycerol synthase transmembrane domain-containing protein [Roseobacteraceae]MBC58967.1 TIGR00374 family protein [Actibacterium sp.]|tara:strand:+ start:996 stop:2105 length:1110 start_codon:yes stop_codon:yes gene_type:complete
MTLHNNPENDNTALIPEREPCVTGTVGKKGIAWLLSALLFCVLTVIGLFSVSALFDTEAPIIRIDPRLLSSSAVAQIALLLVAYYACDGLRLYFVLRALGERVPLKDIGPLVFINLYFSNITPMATGGGLAQVWYLQKRGVPIGVSGAATSIRTILAMLMVFGAAPAFQLLAPPMRDVWHPNERIVQSVSWAMALYVTGLLIVLFRSSLVGTAIGAALKVASWLGILDTDRRDRWIVRMREEMTGFSRSFWLFVTGKPLYAVLSLFFTACFLLILFAFPGLLLSLLGYPVDWLSVMATVSVVTFLMYFAPTPGGAGISELTFASLMTGQVSSAHLLLIVFAWRLLTIYLGVTIGAIFTFMAMRSRSLVP